MTDKAKYTGVVLLLVFLSLALSAQEKSQSYYNQHENEIIPDATYEFKKGNYERTILLCNWHYIIVGDNSAQSLRERAELCAQLTSEMFSSKDEAEEKIKNARLLALALLSINPDDSAVRELLQWSERTISDTLSSSLVSHLPFQQDAQEQEFEQKHESNEMVDLGLSVKWATCNIGASKPEEIGYSFAWGETSYKDGGSWDDYKWCEGTYKELTQYCDNADYGVNGFTDTKKYLSFEDDAAHFNRGEDWRMPTDKEIIELMNECDWEWTQLSEVDGYWITSKRNGKRIFLPVDGSRGFYWTSTLCDERPYSAVGLCLRSDSVYTSPYDRCYSFLIRPVTK